MANVSNFMKFSESVVVNTNRHRIVRPAWHCPGRKPHNWKYETHKRTCMDCGLTTDWYREYPDNSDLPGAKVWGPRRPKHLPLDPATINIK